MDVALEVLKWAAVVFAAGVVAQLGKSLTLKILAAQRRRRQEPAGRDGSASDTAPPAEPTLAKRELKQRKKQLKTETKLRKKKRVKTSVLTVLLALSLACVAVAGFATYLNWAWLEQHHLAGLASLETFFALVAAVFAVVIVRREWAELSSGAVAQLYLAALGILLVAFFAVGVGLLVLGWLSLWGSYRLHSFVTAHPLLTLAILAVAWGLFAARSRRRAGARGRRPNPEAPREC